MARFEELQELWQSQPAPLVSGQEAASLAGAFARYGRRQDLINLAKVAILAWQLVYLFDRLWNHSLALLGALLTDAALVCFLVYEWRGQRAIARLNFAASSRDFLKSAIARLNAQRDPFHTRQGYLMLGGAWVGLSLLVAGKWQNVSIPSLAAREGICAVFVWALLPIGTWMRGKRWNLECQPLVERLTALLEGNGEKTE
jgi:hypothetical protein